MNNVTKLFSLFVVSVVVAIFIPACESGIEKSISPVPIAELRESTPEGVVTVGNVEQVNPVFCPLVDPFYEHDIRELRRKMEDCLGVQQ